MSTSFALETHPWNIGSIASGMSRDARRGPVPTVHSVLRASAAQHDPPGEGGVLAEGGARGPASPA